MTPDAIASQTVKRHERLTFLSLVVAGFIHGSVLVAGGVFNLRVNLTPSEPMGIWRILPLSRDLRVGDIVFICPPDTPIMREARSRGYLRHGLCKGGFAPLIKTVVALPGQTATIGSDVRIDDGPLAHSTVLRADAKGRLLPLSSNLKVPSGSVFVHSAYAGSFDSRYFGPLPVLNILGIAQAILI